MMRFVNDGLHTPLIKPLGWEGGMEDVPIDSHDPFFAHKKRPDEKNPHLTDKGDEIPFGHVVFRG